MLAHNILDVVFPRFCLGCGYVGRYLCPQCEDKLKKKKTAPRCIYCKKKSFLGLTHPSCKRKRGVDGHLSAYLYGGLFKKIIHSVKYGGATEVLKELMAVYMGEEVASLSKWNSFSPFTIQVVPLHKKRLKERGFNQVDFIARPLLNYFKGEHPTLLKKTKITKGQATLSTNAERLNNIRGSFACVSNAAQKSVLLVDDVVTTGATIKECSKTLKKNGTQHVFVFSLARG